MSSLDSIVAACLVPLAIFTLVSGLDDFVLVVVMLRGLILGKRNSDGAAPPRGIREKRIAVFVPLWREHEVIDAMLEHNLAAIRYRNYDIFLGTYPNDGATRQAVREFESRFPNVHLCTCPHDGPTSKGDCLNWVYESMLLEEQRAGIRFDAVVTHDAEDLIHPDALHWINYHLDRFEMVQLPVLPLPTPLWMLTHGVYCDEFAEYQTKDVPARQAMGSFVPSNGVGTGYSRRALDALASQGRPFEPGCLTEDYENGIRLYRLGMRQLFVPIRFRGGRPVATREYFPRDLRGAIRQRTRWITGIALQSWERYGWRGGIRVAYWFWRDRKGLLGNPASVLGNIVFVYGLGTLLYSRLTESDRGLAHAWSASLLAPAIALIFALQAVHVTVRAGCVARIYGWRFAAGVPLRMLWANWINSVATFLAVGRYGLTRLRRRSPAWTKTEHNYPTPQNLATLGLLTGAAVGEALAAWQGPGVRRIEPAAVRPAVARALPLKLVTRWKVIPYRVENGCLFVAGPELPTDAAERSLRRHTRLRTRFHLIRPENFEQLVRQLL